METILVPVDFSQTAKSAALYALNIAKQLGVSKILLFNAYQQPVATDANMTPMELVDFDELKGISANGLENFKVFLTAHDLAGVELETLSEFTLLTDGINDVCNAHNVDLIVMGVTGGGKLGETLVGSTAVDVAKIATRPVIVLPPGITFRPIRKIVFACDLKKVLETTPVREIKQILDATKSKLVVLNIDHDNKHFTTETPYESLMLDTLLDGYEPEYHFVDSVDFIEAVNSFAEDKEADLVITIPKKHNFFEKLVRESHTKKLAFHSHVPLMVVHD